VRTANGVSDLKVSEEVKAVLTQVFSADQAFYCIGEVAREGGLWLGVEKRPLPVVPMLRRPAVSGAAVMRGRGYWRRFTMMPLAQGNTTAVPADDGLVNDYRDAAWWTPGLEQTWAEADELHQRLRTLEVNFKAAVEQTRVDTQAADAELCKKEIAAALAAHQSEAPAAAPDASTYHGRKGRK
jgi:hypothetical protein